jgi:hypothetical protein
MHKNGERTMNNWLNRVGISSSLLIGLGALLGAVASPAWADDDAPASVTASFGGGLNTAQPGNKLNHVILPKHIKVRLGGVVNFVVAGFHQPTVYRPGTLPANIIVPPDANVLLIDDPNNRVYIGPLPFGPPPQGLSNTQNRVESVRFDEVGTWLVICNVRGHFLDGMYAFVQVVNP